MVQKKGLKFLFIMIVALMFIMGEGLYALNSSTSSSSQAVKKKRVIVKKKRDIVKKKRDIVYVNKRGNKFHHISCPLVKRSRISMTRSEAVRRNYKPCKKCKGGASVIKKPIVVKKKAKAVRCKAITRKGVRCKKKTKHPSGLCEKHRG